MFVLFSFFNLVSGSTTTSALLSPAEVGPFTREANETATFPTSSNEIHPFPVSLDAWKLSITAAALENDAWKFSWKDAHDSRSFTPLHVMWIAALLHVSRYNTKRRVVFLHLLSIACFCALEIELCASGLGLDETLVDAAFRLTGIVVAMSGLVLCDRATMTGRVNTAFKKQGNVAFAGYMVAACCVGETDQVQRFWRWMIVINTAFSLVKFALTGRVLSWGKLQAKYRVSVYYYSVVSVIATCFVTLYDLSMSLEVARYFVLCFVVIETRPGTNVTKRLYLGFFLSFALSSFFFLNPGHANLFG